MNGSFLGLPFRAALLAAQRDCATWPLLTSGAPALGAEASVLPETQELSLGPGVGDRVGGPTASQHPSCSGVCYHRPTEEAEPWEDTWI